MLHADSADISSTDMKIWGGKPRIGTTGSGGSVLRQCGIFLSVLMLTTAGFGAAIPKDSKVLGATKGKPVETGVVFVNGKYIEPPYVVQRWGCGIKINKETVIAEVIPWGDFAKTQSGVKTMKDGVEVVPSAKPAPEAAKPAKPAEDSLDTSLDDLFDDPPPAKKKAAVAIKLPPPKPAPQITYAWNGEFVRNEAVKAMIQKVNATRTEIDSRLRMGGFVCFGDGYSRISGDSDTAYRLLVKIPELQRTSTDAADFIGRIRANRMEYLTEPLCVDLFRNRLDYRKLQERGAKWREEEAMRKMLEKAGEPTL